MRRRFGRNRRAEGGQAIDAARWLGRLAEEGIVAGSLEPVSVEGIPAELAAVGVGETPEGQPLVVGFSPRSGGDAALGAVALATERAATGQLENGVALAVAPSWSVADRRRLGLLAPRGFRLEALEPQSLAEHPGEIVSEPIDEPRAVPIERVVGQLGGGERDLFERAVAGLAGLAAKHGGGVRGRGNAVELVVLARRVATVRPDESEVVLETWMPRRAAERLHLDRLSDALDRLEGLVRKRLNERGVRDAEEGLRGQAVARVAATAGLRAVVRWPLGGWDPEMIDFVGVDAAGKPVAGVIRQAFGLGGLGPVLDAAVALGPYLPVVLGGAEPPVQLGPARLLLVGESFDDAVIRVLSEASLEVERVALAEGELAVETLSEGAPAPDRSRGRRRRGGRTRGRRRPGGEEAEAEAAEVADVEAVESSEPADAAESAPEPEPAARRIEQLSTFDLLDGDDDDDDDDGGGGGGRGRGRARRGGRRRRRRPGGGEGENGAGSEPERERSGEPAEARGDEGEREDGEGRGRRRGRRRGSRRRRGEGERGAEAADESEDAEAEPDAEPDDSRPEDEELADGLVRLADAPEPEDAVEPAAAYDDEEEVGETVSEQERMRQERLARRRARMAKAAPEPEPESKPAPRRRAALLIHADRSSLLAGILLARDLRLVEGLWVYPQDELMTFFRSVATDLREETPIHVVGFTASPARDALQAAALYRERIQWYDHQVWPPEDLEGLRQAIGADAVHVEPGLDSVLPLVLALGTRRSRFSDKLVELATARFSEHDFGRWGRVWWARLEEMAGRHGDRRSDLEPLLAGRPSDLSREASKVPTPDPPRELAWVAERDLRIAHFGGYSLVVVPTPPELDLLLTARIARERFEAPFSLAWTEGGEQLVLAGDDSASKRSYDLLAMADHLANKHRWIEALPDADQVARFRVRGHAEHPERIDAVVAEIAMSRSILEG